jgi:glyceraldehyde 3-phosphate dehydrogenase
MLRVAINGYGRIGRNVHRQFLESYNKDVEVVGINASSDAEMRAYLLKYDSLHGRSSSKIEVADENTLTVDGKPVRVVRERDPGKCPWKDLKVDIVIESTGSFEKYDEVKRHLDAGARKVVVTAPMKDDTPTIVKGVNDEILTPKLDIISNASCTTNCIAPVIKIIDEAYGVEHLLVSSVHAFTASQNLLDNKNKEGGELRRARAATLSMIPTKTGAVTACAKIFPHLTGKIDGMAFRVPVPTVSCAYMAFFLKNATSTKDVNALLKEAASSPEWKGILDISEELCVSIDFQTDPHSSIIDAPSTKVVDGKAAQILSWYDNEWGYAMRVTEMALKMGSFLS